MYEFFAASTFDGFMSLITGVVILIYLSLKQKLLPAIALPPIINPVEKSRKAKKRLMPLGG